MTAVLVMATALLGGLFWANYRRPRSYYGGPIGHDIIADDAELYCGDDSCDDVDTDCAADDYQDNSSNDYSDSSSASNSRDE